MTALTNLLERLSKLEGAATPGPWLNDSHFFQVYSEHLQDHGVDSLVCDTDINSEQGDDANERNAELITAARNSLGPLIRIIRRQHEALVNCNCVHDETIAEVEAAAARIL